MTNREEWLDALLAAGGDGLALFAPDARVLVVNRRLAQAMGRTVADMEGMDAVAAGLPAALADAVAAVAATGLPAETALPAAGAVRLAPVHDGARRVRAVAALADGGRAEAERARTAAARFLSAANHDLRQPFQAMQLFHHLLLQRVADSGGRYLVERLGQAIEGADVMLRSLVEVARLEAGIDRPGGAAAVPLDDLFAKLLQEFEAGAEGKGLRLIVRPCGASVSSDAAFLERLLRQYLSNAVRLTERGGVLLAARRCGDAVRIEVWDSGPGLHPDDAPRIFDDFHKAHGSAAKKGAGFGLAIARRLAEALGHAVAVRSRPGRGSVFSVTAPLADAASEAMALADLEA
ncbi:sensor histidine kinase [Azospirillum sp. ST 5-10]|uniref:sensor histidine kinase n=1 Tax=unclassified Azospirillum TaxID=2630922 RepID=UPI003F4A715B